MITVQIIIKADDSELGSWKTTIEGPADTAAQYESAANAFDAIRHTVARFLGDKVVAARTAPRAD